MPDLSDKLRYIDFFYVSAPFSRHVQAKHLARSVMFVFMMLITNVFVMQVSAAESDRFALVIGNASYPGMPLANPRNDANDISTALASLGFHVTTVLDADKHHMDMALEEFARQIDGHGGAAIIYYAGHAMQYENDNFLFPVDAVLKDKYSVRHELISVKDVKDAFQGCDCLKILVLDSCRSNPLASKVLTERGPSARGLAPFFERSDGMIVSYATRPGDIAEDGIGRNSPYAQAFLLELRQPQVPVIDLFLNIQSDVKTATHDRQKPEVSIPDLSRSERLYFLNQNEGDASAFDNLDFSDLDQLRQFVERFPNSAKRPSVERRIAALEKILAIEQARRDVEERNRREIANQESVAQAKRDAELKANQEAVAQAKRDAELKARQEAEAQAKRNAELKANQEAVVQAKRDAELKANQETAEKSQQQNNSRKIVDDRAKKVASRKARLSTEDNPRASGGIKHRNFPLRSVIQAGSHSLQHTAPELSVHQDSLPRRSTPIETAAPMIDTRGTF